MASTSKLPCPTTGELDRGDLRQICTQQSSGKDFIPQASEIIPDRLYLADMYTATDNATLERLGITHVVSVVTQTWHRYPAPIRHLYLPIDDLPTSNLIGYLTSSVAWIKSAFDEDEHAKVMVHCVWGMSRSASIVIAYLMTVGRISLVDALALVKSKRPVVRPNHGFFRQLLAYEIKLRQARLGLHRRESSMGS